MDPGMDDPGSEFALEANGRIYTLRYGNRAFRLFEREAGKPLGALTAESIQEMTLVVWAGLQTHHPDISVEDVDEVIDAVGYTEMTRMVTAALKAALPAAALKAARAQAVEGEAPGNAARAGTGKHTSSRRS